jgi:hypothetical protein
MRRITWLTILAIAIPCMQGCGWNFWGRMFYSESTNVHRSDHSVNHDYDFQQQYDQQSKMAEEYYQKK